MLDIPTDCPEWCLGYRKAEYILCAAIHYDDGLSYAHQPVGIISGYVVVGRRHSDCIYTQERMPVTTQILSKVQGFLTSRNRFLNRHDSYLLALACGQLPVEPLSPSQILVSEDLY